MIDRLTNWLRLRNPQERQSSVEVIKAEQAIHRVEETAKQQRVEAERVRVHVNSMYDAIMCAAKRGGTAGE